MPTPANPSLNLNLVLDQVAKDKGIERSVLIATLEDAMTTAAKKHFGQERNLEAKYDPRKGVVELFQAIVVAEKSPTRPGREPDYAGRGAQEGHGGGGGRRARVPDLLPRRGRRGGQGQDDQYGDILG
jgi:N utilization substance protein A